MGFIRFNRRLPATRLPGDKSPGYILKGALRAWGLKPRKWFPGFSPKARRAPFKCSPGLQPRVAVAGHLLFVALILGAPALQAQPNKPDVLLITVDTLRPDALGWVSGKNETPNIDRLANGGARFRSAISPAPLTLPAHATLMSGLLPRRHGVRDNGQMLGTAPALLAEQLQAAGYQTAAFVSGYPLKGFFGLGRGFDHYDDDVGGQDSQRLFLERSAEKTNAAVFRWLGKRKRPSFIWVHYYDPHYPYEAPGEGRAAYDAEVVRVDKAIGELLRRLDRDNSGQRLTIFAADHGESLGEHGEGTHGFFIYDATMAVPLIFHFPGRLPAAEHQLTVGLVDIAPTVLDLLGLKTPQNLDGRSLQPLLKGGELPSAPAWSETWQPWTSYGWSPLKSVRLDEWKLIAAPKPELYNVAADPGEKRNLVREERGRAHELARHMEELESRPPVGETAAAGDAETLAALRALGYVGGGASAAEPGEGLADPKDRAAEREMLTAADELLRRGDFRGAVAQLDKVLAKEPDNRFAVSRSGEALVQLGDLEKGIERLQQAVALDPERAEVRELLGVALVRAGKLNEALPHWMELARLRPGEARAWTNLGSTFGRLGRHADAVGAFERAASLEPGAADPLVRLAFAEHAAGRPAETARHLQEAAALAGDSFFHHGALGIVLLGLGRNDEARSHLAQSRPQEGDFAAARFELARLEAAAGRRDAARQALNEALAAQPALRARAEADFMLSQLLQR